MYHASSSGRACGCGNPKAPPRLTLYAWGVNAMTERTNADLSAEEIERKVAGRAARIQRDRVTTIGGAVAGGVGAIVGLVAALWQDNIMVALLGFAVMGVGFGIVTPSQIKSFISRGGG